MKPFEEVLAAGGSLIAAWDHLDDARTLLYLFAITSVNAKVAASTTVPLDQQEAMVERLLALGVRIGGTYGSNTFVWAADEQAFSVWSHEAVVSVPPTKAVTGVSVFYDHADPGHRGVRFALPDGSHEIFVEEHDPTPGLDPTYGADELETDSRWARYLGEDLAVWFLVPLIDEITDGSIEADIAIAHAARDLARQVEQVSASEVIAKSLGPIRRARELVFRFAPDPREPATHVLEIQVTEKTTATTVLKRGTRAQIAAFLRRVSTPATTLWAMNGLINSFAQLPDDPAVA